LRKMTRQTECRGVKIGGGAPVSIQSMTNTDTRDAAATLGQIRRLERAGCQIVRIAVSDDEGAEAFGEIRKKTDMPLVADIQFDYRMALASAEKGADAVRINPGNIGSRERIKAVADACKARNIPIRVGVNSGSVEKDILEKYGGVTPEGLAESAVRNVRLLEESGFDDIVISAKASDVRMNFETYKILSEMTDYPLHIGVTESGDKGRGAVKSAAGLGALLLEGIGDTIRVSLTGDPVDEIPVAREILKCTGNLNSGINLVSCPTCSRCRTDMPAITSKVMEVIESREPDLIKRGHPMITVAVMGCAVNGPGEAREADLGAACGDGKAVIFSEGKILKTVPEEQIAEALTEEIDRITEE
jgi:(E)-4-hydroxy-3-methylbut-2-enyl-diphosphate synthase